jgi:hypothetical protein
MILGAQNERLLLLLLLLLLLRRLLPLRSLHLPLTPSDRQRSAALTRCAGPPPLLLRAPRCALLASPP